MNRRQWIIVVAISLLALLAGVLTSQWIYKTGLASDPAVKAFFDGSLLTLRRLWLGCARRLLQAVRALLSSGPPLGRRETQGSRCGAPTAPVKRCHPGLRANRRYSLSLATRGEPP